MAGMAVIELYVKKAWYDVKKPIINDFSLSVLPGETVTVTGPSGAGKTTLLSIIAGLHRRYEGTAEISGRIALIPQKNCLPPFLTVYDNITLVAGAGGRKPDRHKVFALLEELGLGGLEKRYPVSLSGGQCRRVALGQALYSEPDILLMDEPFSALDAAVKFDMISLLLDMQQTRRAATVFVTHDMTEAEALGGRTARLNDG